MANVCLNTADTRIAGQSFNRYNIFTDTVNTNPPMYEQREKDNRAVGQKLNYFCEPMYSYN